MSTNETMWQDPQFCGESWVHMPNMMALKYIFIETFSFSELYFECETQLGIELPVCCISSWSGLFMGQGANLVQPDLATDSTWDFFDQHLIWKFVWWGLLDIRATTVLSSSSNGLSLSVSLSLLKVCPSGRFLTCVSLCFRSPCLFFGLPPLCREWGPSHLKHF
jgi:hypothetical protein